MSWMGLRCCLKIGLTGLGPHLTSLTQRAASSGRRPTRALCPSLLTTHSPSRSLCPSFCPSRLPCCLALSLQVGIWDWTGNTAQCKLGALSTGRCTVSCSMCCLTCAGTVETPWVFLALQRQMFPGKCQTQWGAAILSKTAVWSGRNWIFMFKFLLDPDSWSQNRSWILLPGTGQTEKQLCFA